MGSGSSSRPRAERVDLDDGAHAGELRVAANPDDDASAARLLRRGDARDEARARRGSGREAEGVRAADEALARRAALDDRRRPGRTRTVFTRRVTGCPGRTAATDVGTRAPPPAAGMQPMNGRKVGARSD